MTASLDDLNTQLKLGNQNTSQAIVALNAIATNLAAFAKITTGSFTMSAAATKVVVESAITATSVILLSPTIASAGTLMGGTKSLYISAQSAGVSFTVATASGVSAAGTETFDYVVVNT